MRRSQSESIDIMFKPIKGPRGMVFAVQRHVAKQKTRPHKAELMAMYHKLLSAYGPQHWWPGETAFEVIVGAILTQNTAWQNVEKAIAQLKRARLLTPRALHRVSEKRLASLIRPSGYFNIKAKRLKGFISFLFREYRGNLKEMFGEHLETLRERLLGVKGIGPETADSILLYAGGFPTFVVDAYTRRVFSRHRLVPEDVGYEPLKRFFTSHLPPDAALFNEYHALLVKVGKERCRKEPQCSGCPLEEFLGPSRRYRNSSVRST